MDGGFFAPVQGILRYVVNFTLGVAKLARKSAYVANTYGPGATNAQTSAKIRQNFDTQVTRTRQKRMGEQECEFSLHKLPFPPSRMLPSLPGLGVLELAILLVFVWGISMACNGHENDVDMNLQ